MSLDENSSVALDDPAIIPDQVPEEGFREVREKTSIVAILLGMGVIAAAILLGRFFAFIVPFIAFSIIMTLLWRRAPRPWIYLASIAAATPVAVSKEQFTCNVVFAIWLALLSPGRLFRLPKWTYILLAMASFGFLTGSINWMSSRSTVIGSVIHEGTLAFNFVFAVFILVPMIYVRMQESKDFNANLQGLLFCLILPSTLILLSAKLSGHVANAWEASLHGASEGFLEYRLGKVTVNFLRTEVGFIFGALICASAAIAVSQVKTLYRVLAGACLASNAYLLLFTASFGSMLSTLCGLAAIFYIQLRKVGAGSVVKSAVAGCCMLAVVLGLLSSHVTRYLGERYTQRVTDKDSDRLALWQRGVHEFFQHPEGVGWTLEATGEKEAYGSSFMHNDYLVYFVSYSLTGGVAYFSLVVGLLLYFLLHPPNLESGGPSALAVHMAGLGVINVIAFNSMTDHMTENRWYFTLIWSIVWYCYFCSRATRIDDSRKPADEGDIHDETVITDDDSAACIA